LNDALDCGNITPEAISQVMAMRDRKRKVLAVHKYKITQLPDGRYQTYFKRDGEKRRLVRATDVSDLYEQLYGLYTDQLYLDKITLTDLYEEWITYKASITESPNTVKRHKQHYAKYFCGSTLFNSMLRHVTAIQLNTFCNQLIRDNAMTRHEWTNVKTILKGMFELAEEKEYIKNNPMHKLKITVKFKQVNKKTGETETFNTEEMDRLYAYLDAHYAADGNVAFMAVKLNLMLGLRVGELVALKWGDIHDNMHLHVSREETRNQETGERSVVVHTKTRQDRFVVLVPQAWEILEELYQRAEAPDMDAFIFMRDGNRLTTRQVNYVLEKYAERTSSIKKSSHKLRKTYASVLQSSGVPIDEIRLQLGHSSIQTTLSYIFNPLTSKETIERISGAFQTNLNAG